MVRIPLQSPGHSSPWVALLAALGLAALVAGYSRLTWSGRTSDAS